MALAGEYQTFTVLTLCHGIEKIRKKLEEKNILHEAIIFDAKSHSVINCYTKDNTKKKLRPAPTKKNRGQGVQLTWEGTITDGETEKHKVLLSLPNVYWLVNKFAQLAINETDTEESFTNKWRNNDFYYGARREYTSKKKKRTDAPIPEAPNPKKFKPNEQNQEEMTIQSFVSPFPPTEATTTKASQNAPHFILVQLKNRENNWEMQKQIRMDNKVWAVDFTANNHLVVLSEIDYTLYCQRLDDQFECYETISTGMAFELAREVKERKHLIWATNTGVFLMNRNIVADVSKNKYESVGGLDCIDDQNVFFTSDSSIFVGDCKFYRTEAKLNVHLATTANPQFSDIALYHSTLQQMTIGFVLDKKGGNVHAFFDDLPNGILVRPPRKSPHWPNGRTLTQPEGITVWENQNQLHVFVCDTVGQQIVKIDLSLDEIREYIIAGQYKEFDCDFEPIYKFNDHYPISITCNATGDIIVSARSTPDSSSSFLSVPIEEIIKELEEDQLPPNDSVFPQRHNLTAVYNATQTVLAHSMGGANCDRLVESLRIALNGACRNLKHYPHLLLLKKELLNLEANVISTTAELIGSSEVKIPAGRLVKIDFRRRTISRNLSGPLGADESILPITQEATIAYATENSSASSHTVAVWGSAWICVYPTELEAYKEYYVVADEENEDGIGKLVEKQGARVPSGIIVAILDEPAGRQRNLRDNEGNHVMHVRASLPFMPASEIDAFLANLEEENLVFSSKVLPQEERRKTTRKSLGSLLKTPFTTVSAKRMSSDLYNLPRSMKRMSIDLHNLPPALPSHMWNLQEDKAFTQGEDFGLSPPLLPMRISKKLEVQAPSTTQATVLVRLNKDTKWKVAHRTTNNSPVFGVDFLPNDDVIFLHGMDLVQITRMGPFFECNNLQNMSTGISEQSPVEVRAIHNNSFVFTTTTGVYRFFNNNTVQISDPSIKLVAGMDADDKGNVYFTSGDRIYLGDYLFSRPVVVVHTNPGAEFSDVAIYQRQEEGTIVFALDRAAGLIHAFEIGRSTWVVLKSTNSQDHYLSKPSGITVWKTITNPPSIVLFVCDLHRIVKIDLDARALFMCLQFESAREYYCDFVTIYNDPCSPVSITSNPSGDICFSAFPVPTNDS